MNGNAPDLEHWSQVIGLPDPMQPGARRHMVLCDVGAFQSVQSTAEWARAGTWCYAMPMCPAVVWFAHQSKEYRTGGLFMC
jgi:hypothetical protein